MYSCLVFGVFWGSLEREREGGMGVYSCRERMGVKREGGVWRGNSKMDAGDNS